MFDHQVSSNCTLRASALLWYYFHVSMMLGCFAFIPGEVLILGFYAQGTNPAD